MGFSPMTSRQETQTCFLPRIERIWHVRTLQRRVNKNCTRLCDSTCTSICYTEIGMYTEYLICIQMMIFYTMRFSGTEERWRVVVPAPGSN